MVGWRAPSIAGSDPLQAHRKYLCLRGRVLDIDGAIMFVVWPSESIRAAQNTIILAQRLPL